MKTYETDPFFDAQNKDYPPERVAWDAANEISHFLETLNAESLTHAEYRILLRAQEILKREAEK